ncbi:MAG: OmpA family protein [Bdellovibrionota bacterium]
MKKTLLSLEISSRISSRILTASLLLSGVLVACAPKSGPDKTLGSAALGAAWGAGAGAVIGHQLSPARAGEGVAIGAGFGIVEGALIGANADIIESAELKQERELESLKIKNNSNAQELFNLQAKLDLALSKSANASIYQVFFDTDATSLRLGASKNLEAMANTLKKSPFASKIYVDGHTDDTGSVSYNEELSASRAESVAASLISYGISQDQVVINSYAATRPIGSNLTKEGRQLNRRVDIYIGR